MKRTAAAIVIIALLFWWLVRRLVPWLRRLEADQAHALDAAAATADAGPSSGGTTSAALALVGGLVEGVSGEPAGDPLALDSATRAASDAWTAPLAPSPSPSAVPVPGALAVYDPSRSDTMRPG